MVGGHSDPSETPSDRVIIVKQYNQIMNIRELKRILSAPLRRGKGRGVGVLFLLLLPAATVAQEADPTAPVLEQIEQNNRLLRAVREEVNADLLETKAENNLPDPSVGYTRSYNSRSASQQQDELTVTQGFDFPTAYATRSKYNRLQAEVGERRYAVERRGILLEAKLLCLELIGLNREHELLQMLAVNADSLVALSARRLQSGEATALEVNRARLDLMTLRTELADNASAYRQALQRLTAMNGNAPIGQMVGNAYPGIRPLPTYETLRDEIVPLHRAMRLADAESDAAQKMIDVKRSGWLPRLEVGYKRITSPAEEFNGFTVGTSLPLFSNRGRVKAARARSLSAELKREDTALQVEATLQALYNEARQVEEAMRAYDLPLMDNTFCLLGQALHGGQLSWHEYFVELEALVRRKQSYLQLENRYQRLMAEIYADHL